MIQIAIDKKFHEIQIKQINEPKLNIISHEPMANKTSFLYEQIGWTLKTSHQKLNKHIAP